VMLGSVVSWSKVNYKLERAINLTLSSYRTVYKF
jgi:hypothetical protein